MHRYIRRFDNAGTTARSPSPSSIGLEVTSASASASLNALYETKQLQQILPHPSIGDTDLAPMSHIGLVAPDFTTSAEASLPTMAPTLHQTYSGILPMTAPLGKLDSSQLPIVQAPPSTTSAWTLPDPTRPALVTNSGPIIPHDDTINITPSNGQFSHMPIDVSRPNLMGTHSVGTNATVSKLHTIRPQHT